MKSLIAMLVVSVELLAAAVASMAAVGTTTEVRTEPVTGGPQRLLALMDVGEGDESWL
jgi:hypothetical protein